MIERAQEGGTLELKREIYNAALPSQKIEEQICGWACDLAALANAGGGHIIIGVDADVHERAFELRPLLGDQAKRLADRLRDHAIEYVRPHIISLEIADFQIRAEDWVVIAQVPDSEAKPHMCIYGSQTRYMIRDGNKRRAMTHAEVEAAIRGRSSDQILHLLLQEVRALHSRLAAIERWIEED